jgi:hypothetical protein
MGITKVVTEWVKIDLRTTRYKIQIITCTNLKHHVFFLLYHDIP